MTKLIAKLRPDLFWVILFVTIGLVSWFNRWIFVYKFEPEYWENYYYESQWNIPNSKRVISDEGVYRYVGYRLVNGENPFNVIYWVPPLGEYLYGLSAKYLYNPYFVSYAFYLLSIFVFGLITKEIFPSKIIRWLTIYLFVLNPLLVEQIQQTMLDLPLTLFLMLSIYFLLRVTKKNSPKFIIFSGISLGLMTGTKPAYFVPIIALVIIGRIYYIKRNKSWFYFLPSFVAGYVLAYFCYFMRHPNPIPWIRLHQKIIDFQKNNVGSHDWVNIFRVIFLGRYKGFWVGAKTIFPLNWSTVLPGGTLGLIYVLARNRKLKDDGKILFLAILGSAYIFMNLFIDFWPRYFMPLIPIFTLVLGHLFKDRKWVLVVFLISLMPSLYLLLFPSPTSFLENFNTNYQAGFYRETYRMLSSQTKQVISEAKWKEINRKSSTEKPEIEINNIQQIRPIKENNQWKLEWKVEEKTDEFK